ncbi:flavodoxin-dependent (E)-4-hydroxy-3-methylbut-2-enyl-diphosphate synthase, partial [bacterium]|nr:flavodoxin-dependent (E)-4-hydroxy-3-methylbut-2-enyl-diphosphate synthase [bacterium]
GKRVSSRVRIGNLLIGGGSPVAVQSMTNTTTADVAETSAQVIELAQAGSELVRFTVRDEQDAQAVPYIAERVRAAGINVPLVGDFHYNGHLLLSKYPDCAKALDKYRINPGNMGTGAHHDANFRTMIEIALKNDKAVRIGANGGSIDQELLARLIDADRNAPAPLGSHKVFLNALAESVLNSAALAAEDGLQPERIVLSAKISSVPDAIEVYRQLASRSSCALHVGLTEAGGGDQGIISSAIALGVLLSEGIGDTIRVSVTPRPGESRVREVQIACEVLQALHLRSFFPQVVSCPGCGRTNRELHQKLAAETSAYLCRMMPVWRSKGYKGCESFKVAVMGCVVNGPGEARDAHMGISLPGKGETPMAPVFADGCKWKTLRGEDLGRQFEDCIDEYVAAHFAADQMGGQ